MRWLCSEVTQHSFRIALALIVAWSTGCASSQGFDRAAMREVLHVDPASNPDSPLVIHQNSRLSPPFRLGIVFTHHDFPTRPSIRTIEWLSADRDQLLRELTPLRDEQLIVETFVLTDVTLRGENTLGIRQAGARHGADVVLIIDGVAAVDRYNNFFAWLYPTLIGAYLAPGTESDALVMATGSLWAVRSDWHTPIQTVEGRSKVTGAAAFVDDTAALKQATERSIQLLGMRIVDQLRLVVPSDIKSRPQ